MTTLKYFGLVIAGVIVGLLLSVVSGSTSFGGVYNNVTSDFSEGISVDGTVVIDGSGNVDAPLTPASFKEPVETITADDTLTVAETGKTVFIGTAGVDLTLPAASTAAGITYRVVVSANFATTNMTITGGASDASDDLIFGVLDVAGAVVLCSAEDTISFVNSAELPGDYVELHSNGTHWFMSGQAGTSGGITCTDAD